MISSSPARRLGCMPFQFFPSIVTTEEQTRPSSHRERLEQTLSPPAGDGFSGPSSQISFAYGAFPGSHFQNFRIFPQNLRFRCQPLRPPRLQRRKYLVGGVLLKINKPSSSQERLAGPSRTPERQNPQFPELLAFQGRIVFMAPGPVFSCAASTKAHETHGEEAMVGVLERCSQMLGDSCTSSPRMAGMSSSSSRCR